MLEEGLSTMHLLIITFIILAIAIFAVTGTGDKIAEVLSPDFVQNLLNSLLGKT